MNKFNAIESLRGWMAWWVLLGHAVHLTGLKASLGLVGAILDRGDLAVDVFMIVSGFVITHMTLTRTEAYRPYIARRWWRLAPLFLVMLVIAIASRSFYEVAYIQNPWAGQSSMRIDRLNAESSEWLPHILLHATLLHGLLPDTLLPFSGTAFLAPAWSLSLEWQFYLIAPLIIASLRDWRKGWFSLALIALSVPALFGMMGTWLYKPFLPLALPFFFGGIASRLILDRKAPWLAIGATVLSTAIYVRAHGHNEIWSLLPVAVIWALFLLITAREAGIVAFRSKMFDGLTWAIATNKPVHALGTVSYSTYLCHIPVFAIVVGAGILKTGRTDQELIVQMTAVAIFVSAVLSFALHKYVEQGGNDIGKSLLSRRKVAPAH